MQNKTTDKTFTCPAGMVYSSEIDGLPTTCLPYLLREQQRDGSAPVTDEMIAEAFFERFGDPLGRAGIL